MKRYVLASCICITGFLLTGVFLDRPHVLHALGRNPGLEKKSVADTVEAFNRYYMDVYAAGGSKKMIDLIPASKEMRHRIYKDVGYLDAGGRVLIYDLASLKIEEVRMEYPFLAEAVAVEAWNYAYRDATTRRPLTQAKGMDAAFKYFLKKSGGRWMVYRYKPVRHYWEKR